MPSRGHNNGIAPQSSNSDVLLSWCGFIGTLTVDAGCWQAGETAVSELLMNAWRIPRYHHHSVQWTRWHGICMRQDRLMERWRERPSVRQFVVDERCHGNEAAARMRTGDQFAELHGRDCQHLCVTWQDPYSTRPIPRTHRPSTQLPQLAQSSSTCQGRESPNHTGFWNVV